MMKGLLMKDLKLMLTQFAFFILLPAVGAVFVVPTGEMSMGFGYITAISGLIGVTTVNYDSYDNGFAYLFTLPVSRRGYVKEKYIFAALSSVAVMLSGFSCGRSWRRCIRKMLMLSQISLGIWRTLI